MLELGLLMTEEPGVMEEEDEELYSFQHKLLHEYTAAIYVSKQVEENPHFLSQHFPTHADIYNYREVIAFCVHILRSQNALLPLERVICHVSNTFSGVVYDKLTKGKFEIEFNFKHQFETMFQVILEAMASRKLAKPTHLLSPNAYEYNKKIGKYNAEIIPRTECRNVLSVEPSPSSPCSKRVFTNPPLGYSMSEHRAIKESYHTLHLVTSHQSHDAVNRMISLIEHDFYPWQIKKSTNEENRLLIPAGQKLPEHVLDKTSFFCCDVSDEHSIDLSNYINQCNILLSTINIDNTILSNHGKRPVDTLFNALSKYGCLESLIVRDYRDSPSHISNSYLLTTHLHASLVTLDVSGYSPTSSDIEALAAGIEAGRFPNLQQVNLSIRDIIKSLPNSLHLVHLIPGLKELDISEEDISNSLHLLTEHVQTNLIKLNVSNCNLSITDIEALAAGIETGRFPKLKEVDVSGNDLSKSLHLVHLLPGLEELDVSEKDISNSLHLLTKHVQHSLVKLNIGKLNLTRAVIEVLSTAITEGKFPKLKEIGIDTTSKCQSVQPCQLLPGQTELDLSPMDISNVLHLFTEHVQAGLIKLNVSNCKLTQADTEALAAGIEAGRFPQLQQVDLSINDIIKALPNSLHLVHLFPGLRYLDVSGKDISNSLHLLTDHVQASLCSLSVSQCSLTGSDVSALAAALTAGRLPCLQFINMEGNALDDDAVQPLCEALLQYEGPNQTAQSIYTSGTVHLDVCLYSNKTSAQFREQWKEKLKHKQNVIVFW